MQLPDAEFDVFLESFIQHCSLKDTTYIRPVPEKGMELPSFGWMEGSRLNPRMKKELNVIRNHGNSQLHGTFVVSGNAVPQFLDESLTPYDTLPDAATRYLALTRFWNIINYFSPSLDLCDHWDEAYREYIPRFRNCTSYFQYYQELQQLAARMHDGHGFLEVFPVNVPKVEPAYKMPLVLGYGEGKTYIAAVTDTSLLRMHYLQAGDQVLAWNGRKMENIYDSLLPQLSGSNEAFTREYACRLRLRKTWKEQNSLTLLRAKDTIKVEVTAMKPISLTSGAESGTTGISWKRIHDSLSGKDIGYVDVGLIRKKEVEKAFAAFRDLPFVIIDCRKYPKDAQIKLLNALTPQGGTFEKILLMNFAYPGTTRWESPEKPGVLGKLMMRKALGNPDKHNPNYYKGKVILLVDHLTMSHGEWSVMSFQLAPQVVTIGTSTAGADGNMASISLPGGMKVSFTSMGVYYPDGTRTQRKGVHVDIVVPETIASASGKDVIYQRALDYVRTGK